MHDRLCRKYPGKAIVTLGHGPDFTVLWSQGVLMNIPQMVRELQEEMPKGSIKFVGRLRKDVLAGRLLLFPDYYSSLLKYFANYICSPSISRTN